MPLSKILEKSFNLRVSESINFDFEIKDEGFYLIKVVARAGAWWQQLPILEGKYWLDEELKVFLDEKPIEPYFNGNSLFGTRQFIILFERLFPGSHSLNFKSKGKPLLEAVEVSELNGEPFDLISLIGNKPEDTLLSSFISRKKNWATLVSLSQPFLYLLINARAKDGQQLLFWQTDDEDLQLKLNGEVQKNNEPKSHPFWYWCGRASKGAGKIYEGSFTDQDSIRQIDILSDRSPEVDQLLVSFGSIPTADDPRWVGSFDGDTDVMLLARLIFGESRSRSKEEKIAVACVVRNRLLSSIRDFGFSYHEIILKNDGVHYQFSPMNPSETDNFPRLIDPLKSGDPTTALAWKDSYEVARGVVSGNIIDPTEGAVFFHSKDLSKDEFLKRVPRAVYIKEIGHFIFYGLRS